MGSQRPDAGMDNVDVVIVGGGAAGCVIAARLSEDGSRSVLLLEAGPDLRTKVPDELRNGWTISRETYDWGYTSERTGAGAVRNLWRKKLLGGTSWLTRFASRGAPGDYDEWSALGNVGWGFDDVLPYFTRLETDADFGDQPWHGDRGPMPIRRYLEHDLTEVAAVGLRAMETLGFPLVEDHNQPGAVGVGRMPMTSRAGVRSTTADAYLPAVGARPNLSIRANAPVADVMLEGVRAMGVRLLDGTSIRARSVVLCGGTYGSPPILLRSGIGPAVQLRSLGIPVRIDLPGVGANLADHPTIGIECGYRGPIREAPTLHVIGTFHSVGRRHHEPPDLMLWLSDPNGPTGGPVTFDIEVALMKPRSRGVIRLRSADPAAAPRIHLPDLQDPSDVERLAEGYGRAMAVANRPEVRRYADPPQEVAGGDALRRWIRANAYSVPHVVGTCSMGPRPEDGAVVDAWGRVHGTEGLIVADASIMPTVPSGFTHLPTIMIAERLSDRIAAGP